MSAALTVLAYTVVSALLLCGLAWAFERAPEITRWLGLGDPWSDE